MYHFDFNIKSKDQLIHSIKGYSLGFRADFNHQLRELLLEFDKYSFVWNSVDHIGYFVHTTDGFYSIDKIEDE